MRMCVFVYVVCNESYIHLLVRTLGLCKCMCRCVRVGEVCMCVRSAGAMPARKFALTFSALGCEHRQFPPKSCQEKK